MSSSQAAAARSSHSPDSNHSTEITPLLARNNDPSDDEEAANNHGRSSAASSLRRSIEESATAKSKTQRRWPSILALSVLCMLVVVIMVGGFFAPEMMEEYSRQALVFEPSSLSLDSFTETGVKARVQGEFTMDASRVKKKAVRDLGRFGTWIASQVETRSAEVEVSLPERGNTVLGYALVPPIKVSVRNGHTTYLDFLADLQPGEKDGLRKIATDWIDGRLGTLRVLGKAELKLKSGLFSFGTQVLSQSFIFEGDDLPAIPEYKIKSLKLHEDLLPNGEKGLIAKAALKIANRYPVDFAVPPLAFEILSGGCKPKDEYIMLADAVTNDVHVKPKQDFGLNVTGFINKLPEKFIEACPGSDSSPLDSLMGNYINGEKATVYVRGAKVSSEDTPQWLADLIAGVTVPVPFTGHTIGHLIRNFTLTDVNFELPSPWAEPDTPEAQPRISAGIKALISVPEEANIPINVDRIRAVADVYYHDKKFGYLDIHKWRNATSAPAKDAEDGSPLLLVESKINKAPLKITDEDTFTEVIAELFAGSGKVKLTVKADVDVDVQTALGQFVVRKIPAKGVVPVETPRGGDFKSLAPKVGDLKILETGSKFVTLGAKVNITNPTEYSAKVPYASLNVLVNGTVLGRVMTENMTIVPGENRNIAVKMLWEPAKASGTKGVNISEEFISQWLSGYNTSLTLKTYEGTIPTQPSLGRALGSLEVELPTPKLHVPKNPNDGDGDDDEDGDDHPRFIRNTTMHLVFSTATFVLFSPLKLTTLYVTQLNATAYYHDHVAGRILYDSPIKVSPGETTTPDLPVDWSIGSVGFDAIKNAIGGTLKLDSYAIAGLRIEEYELTVWFEGKGIGTKIQA